MARSTVDNSELAETVEEHPALEAGGAAPPGTSDEAEEIASPNTPGEAEGTTPDTSGEARTGMGKVVRLVAMTLVLRFLAMRTVLRRIATGAVLVIAVAAIVLSTVFGWKLHQRNEIQSASDAALAAARAYALTLTTVDSGNLDGNFKAVLDGATGDFKDMYSRSSGRLRQLLLDNKATGKGTVLDAAVKSATTSKVEVLLFVDQTVTNSAAPDARVDRSRVQMTMELVGDRWLASEVTLP
ncbi:hypothetical protein NONO_c29700 [Nocardia nova SH22a]|uniref:Mce-associated membrane protein n=1 Tax=Nocardia nova SH22a TaxID=1415166 RepID=W5TEU5_9NOCA|nr:hypothetical protein [Nocardia nova]AHH17757.1 hypothetical protein NONO_c29700 [Nocardia nova SH22a]